MAPLMVSVMLDGSHFGCFGSFSGSYGLIISDGSIFRCCMVRWVVFRMLYGPMGRFLDVVWYDLNIR